MANVSSLLMVKITMEAWKAILVALGGNAALIAVLAWLSKSIITEWLKQVGTDRQIIYSKLHEKRTEAVSAIHIGLIEYLSLCKKFLMSAPHVEEDRIQELLSQLGQGAKEFPATKGSNLYSWHLPLKWNGERGWPSYLSDISL